MRDVITIMVNELRLLLRDRSGLILLFAMPLILVLVMTLVQENILKGPDPGSIQVVILDRDEDPFTGRLARRLSTAASIVAPEVVHGADTPAVSACENQLNMEKAQFCIIVPAGFSKQFQKAARLAAARNLQSQNENGAALVDIHPLHLKLIADPAVRGATKMIVTGVLTQTLAQMEVEEILGAMSTLMTRHLTDKVATQMGMPQQMVTSAVGDDLEVKWRTGPLIEVNDSATGIPESTLRVPTASQHNVPAWALFGMFFIVVPLSSTMIRERQSGLFVRLQTLPVAPLSAAAGKLLAYAEVCFVQFVVILLMGRFVLPLLGVEALKMGDSLVATILITLCSAIAAAAYGVMIGTVSKTQEQAAAIGPVSIVAAAAVGGLMVPIFAMPEVMQALSHLSPLAWGHSAYMAVFLRGAGVAGVGWQVTLLVLFSALNLAIAAVVSKRRQG